MEALAGRQFIEQLEDGALGRRERQRPIPLAPRLCDPGAMDRIVIAFFVGLGIPFETGDAARHRLVRKKPVAAVPNEADIERQLGKPARSVHRPVEVYVLDAARKIMREALQFEGRTSPDGERLFEKRLQRYDSLLPRQQAARAPVDTACRLFQPTCRDIVGAERSGVAVSGQPPCIDQQALGQIPFQPV